MWLGLTEPSTPWRLSYSGKTHDSGDRLVIHHLIFRSAPGQLHAVIDQTLERESEFNDDHCGFNMDSTGMIIGSITVQFNGHSRVLGHVTAEQILTTIFSSLWSHLSHAHT